MGLDHEAPQMIRFFTATTIVPAGALLGALLGLLTFSACQGAPPPFGTPYQEYRGFKARTFRGTPAELRPAVVETLREQGFEVHAAGEDQTFVTATKGMGAAAMGSGVSRREWTRVGVQVRQVDFHRRAPRTLVEINAEPIQGTSDGPIEASFGTITTEFYEGFFESLEVRAEVLRPRMVSGFLTPN